MGKERVLVTAYRRRVARAIQRVVAIDAIQLFGIRLVE
jgi:hypothetical protein